MGLVAIVLFSAQNLFVVLDQLGPSIRELGSIVQGVVVRVHVTSLVHIGRVMDCVPDFASEWALYRCL